MGRFVKNKELKSASYSIRAPYGYSAVGPDSPVDGLFRFNSTSLAYEGYVNGSWKSFAFTGISTVEKDSFVGDGTTTSFGPIARSYAAGEEVLMLVFVGNIFQNPGVAYTVLGTTVTFTSPPNDLQPIVILHGFAG